MCICAQPSPTGSTPDSYVVSLAGVVYVTVSALLSASTPARPPMPSTTITPTTPYVFHTPFMADSLVAHRSSRLPADAVESGGRVGQPQVRQLAVDQPQVGYPLVRHIGACTPDPVHMRRLYPRIEDDVHAVIR